MLPSSLVRGSTGPVGAALVAAHSAFGVAGEHRTCNHEGCPYTECVCSAKLACAGLDWSCRGSPCGCPFRVWRGRRAQNVQPQGLPLHGVGVCCQARLCRARPVLQGQLLWLPIPRLAWPASTERATTRVAPTGERGPPLPSASPPAEPGGEGIRVVRRWTRGRPGPCGRRGRRRGRCSPTRCRTRRRL